MLSLTRGVVKNPRITIAVIALFTLLFAYNMRYVKMDPDITSSLPKDIPAKLLYDRMNEIFPSRDFLLIAVESDEIFSLRQLIQYSHLPNI